VEKAGSFNSSQSSNLLTIIGVIEFWNSQKGYGFVKAPNLPEDAYLSRRSGGQFADQLRSGARVKATVARQRFGKFAIVNVENIT
jgi:cold shock CspA family protein